MIKLQRELDRIEKFNVIQLEEGVFKGNNLRFRCTPTRSTVVQ